MVLWCRTQRTTRRLTLSPGLAGRNHLQNRPAVGVDLQEFCSRTRGEAAQTCASISCVPARGCVMHASVSR